MGVRCGWGRYFYAMLSFRRLFYLGCLLLVVGSLAGCRTCPIDVCHARKAHFHNGVKYRARPIWKMQYPAVGEKYKNKYDGRNKRRKSDHSQPLK